MSLIVEEKAVNILIIASTKYSKRMELASCNTPNGFYI